MEKKLKCGSEKQGGHLLPLIGHERKENSLQWRETKGNGIRRGQTRFQLRCGNEGRYTCKEPMDHRSGVPGTQ